MAPPLVSLGGDQRMVAVWVPADPETFRGCSGWSVEGGMVSVRPVARPISPAPAALTARTVTSYLVSGLRLLITRVPPCCPAGTVLDPLPGSQAQRYSVKGAPT